ncbi:MAG: alpha-galactosidase [Victivallaceae bacterium]|nr:alpha-galactosidase [Victivallaceae bacterium]
MKKNLTAMFLCCASFLAVLPGFGAETDLSFVNPADVSQDWTSAKVNRSVNGTPLRVGGITYSKGLGTHAESILALNLGGGATRISGLVGVDDEINPGEGSVDFRLIDGATGKTLWKSATMNSGMAAEPFSVDVSGIGKLFLATTDAGNGNVCDHGDWLDVKIEYTGDAPVSMPSSCAAETDGVQWRFSGMPNGKFKQTGFGGRCSMPAPALCTFPPREEDALLLPANLKIVQSDGSCNVELVFKSSETKAISNDVTEHIYHLEDPAYKLAVDVTVTAYKQENVFESQMSITNNGNAPIMILNRDAAFVALPSGNTYISSFNGNGMREFTGFSESPAPRGIVEHRVAGTDRTALPDYPGVFISFDGPAKEESGRVFAAAVAWSGSWQYKVTRLPDERMFFSGGALDDPIKLRPAETYRSPRVIMTWSDSGKGQASRNFHNYARKYGIMNGFKERPIVLNSWEGVVFWFDENKLISMMDGAADLGVEMFVLDDGWFGNEYPRNSDRAGLGDWEVNRTKLPGGIGKLVEEAHKRGLKFGLWVEPEMVNPESNLYHAHPDWIMSIPNRTAYTGRNQYLLDLSNPEVEEFIYNTVSRILRENPGIEYIKWDHNMNGQNAGAAHLGDNQGALSDKHNEAYYRIMARLRKEFPNVAFQLCASGGARIDYGAMKYHEEFWPSDQSNGIKRVPIQWGISHFFPTNTMASHINRYEDGDFKLRADVAMTGRLGVELCPDILNASDRETVKRGIAAYKELRPLLHSADLYRGRSPFESTTTELTFVSQDKKQAVFFAFKLGSESGPMTLVMSGLNPDTAYDLIEINPDETPRAAPGTFSGRQLMETGVKVDFPAKPSSVVLKLTAQ